MRRVTVLRPGQPLWHTPSIRPVFTLVALFGGRGLEIRYNSMEFALHCAVATCAKCAGVLLWRFNLEFAFEHLDPYGGRTGL